MEYASQGTLRDFILKVKNITETQAYQIITQLAIGLGELHANNIIHRDYKSMNIFINQNLFKIGDLGVSKQIEQENFLCQTITGSPYYLSPELCKGEPYTYAVDIYALGVTMYELLNQGHHPFEASNQAALLVNILKGKYQQLSFKYSKNLKNIVYSCLQQDPQQRPTIYDILSEQIIQQIINQNNFILSENLQQKIHQNTQNYHFDVKTHQKDVKSVANHLKSHQNFQSENQSENQINSIESETIQLTGNTSHDSVHQNSTYKNSANQQGGSGSAQHVGYQNSTQYMEQRAEQHIKQRDIGDQRDICEQQGGNSAQQQNRGAQQRNVSESNDFDDFDDVSDGNDGGDIQQGIQQGRQQDMQGGIHGDRYSEQQDRQSQQGGQDTTTREINMINQYIQQDKQLFQKFQQILSKMKQFKLQQKVQDQIMQYYRMNQKPVFQDVLWLLDGVKQSDLKQIEGLMNQYADVQRERQFVQKQLNTLIK